MLKGSYITMKQKLNDNSPTDKDGLIEAMREELSHKQEMIDNLQSRDSKSILEKAQAVQTEAMKWKAAHAAIHATERVLITAIKETSETERARTPEERMHNRSVEASMTEKGLDKLIPFVSDVIATIIAMKK